MKLSKILWILPFLSFLLGYFLVNQIFNIKKEVEIPYLVGTSIIQATKTLSDYNLNIRILSEKEETDLIPGTIISQTPVNQKVKQNQTVYVVISKKPDLFKMPNFTGKKIDEIKSIISKENIKSKIYYIQSLLPEDYCFAQYPNAETKVEDRKVLLYISSGNNKEVIFPNFKGSELNKIINLLNLNNIKVKIIMKNKSQEYNPQANYTILDQRPFAGSLIKLNANLVVQLIID